MLIPHVHWFALTLKNSKSFQTTDLFLLVILLDCSVTANTHMYITLTL